ncbi:MAG: ATP-binding cassette domain-containing protein [Sphingobacteriales bacterium]|uniref:ABC transporter ATP-binding protein n=1 Tax=Hydrotalea flava TaxID=714549 RepID=UPI000833FBD5|nr:ABC transporter ATP-binding protein [Hydrotalea flava]RTL50514.1 MAG: ATP-binding cassette domain-containing protein [Sphingobacteriales bacterium]
MEPIIQVKNLSKQFGDIVAVNDLSFTVPAGSVYGFLGQNGAGKSTTIRMLLSLITPTEGNIRFFGLPLQQHRKEIFKNIGAIIERPDLYGYLSAYDNLKMFACLNGMHPTHLQLMNQLEQVGLADRAKNKVKTFSQGMKQRLGIGIALIHNPSLIILDEPTNGLDPQGIADIRRLIVQLSKEQQKTILLSSHLLSEIEQMATHILIIDKGKKIIADSAAALFNPAETIVEIETTNNIASLAILKASKWQPHLQLNRGPNIFLKMHHDQIPDFNRALFNLNIQLLMLQPRHSLEDYFLQVTANSNSDTLILNH